jgi:hypothetical protein
MLIFYSIALVIILSVGLLTFVLFRNKNKLLAVLLSLCAMSVLVLGWPIPIHGGFTFLGAAIYDEWSRDIGSAVHDKNKQKHQNYLDKLTNRFQGELPIQQIQTLSERWAKIIYNQNQSAWLDTTSGQIWSNWQLLPATDSLPPLQIAKHHCSEQIPTGFWSLATQAEYIVMSRNSGAAFMSKSGTNIMTYTIDTDFKMEMPSYRVKGGGNSFGNKIRRFSVRCIARGPGSPERGYIKQDISLGEWNRYQLSKLNGKQ